MGSVTLLLALTAAATAAEPTERVITASYGRAASLEFWTTTPTASAELAGRLRLEPGLELSVAARRLLGAEALHPATAFELAVAARAAPAIAQGALGGSTWRWSPAVGLELGLTGAYRRDWETVAAASPWGLEREDGSVQDVVYASALLDPLHGRVGPVALSVGSLSLGSTLPSWGELARLELTFLRLGVVF
ncbi:hypothetical protein L6R49_15085 [Myxococcota bacterium]|nr:hypothetical protein [Myxococcota bacterium]